MQPGGWYWRVLSPRPPGPDPPACHSEAVGWCPVVVAVGSVVVVAVLPTVREVGEAFLNWSVRALRPGVGARWAGVAPGQTTSGRD